jgi:predicted nuclease with TOPRIM domain
MNAPTRYIYKEVKLSKLEALEERASELEAIANDIQRLKAEITGLEEDYETTRNSPLRETTTRQYALHPGDEGYEDAPYELTLHAHVLSPPYDKP